MDKISALINTSVDDAKASLLCTLNRDPQEAKDTAEHVLAAIPSLKGNMTRVAMLRTIIRKANKQLLATSK